MKIKPRALMLSLVAMLATGLPSYADVPADPAPAGEETADPSLRGPLGGAKAAPAAADSTKAPAPASTSELVQTKAEKRAAAPADTGGESDRSLVGGIVGAAVEAPAAMCRQSAREFDAGVKDLTNDSSNPLLKAPAMLITLPFSIAAGCVQGAIYALRYQRNDTNAPDNLRR